MTIQEKAKKYSSTRPPMYADAMEDGYIDGYNQAVIDLKTNEGMKFELSEKQLKQYNKWKKKLPKVDEGKFGAAGGGYWYKFIPTGIGMVVMAGRDDVPDMDINLTDYDSF